MIRAVLFWLCLANVVQAEVRVDRARSFVRDGWWRLEVAFGLSDDTPFRVFTLDEPRRLVIDLADANWSDVDPIDLLEHGRATGVRNLPIGDGWTRTVIDLAEPLVISQAGMTSDTAMTSLTIRLDTATAQEFAAVSGPPVGVPLGVAADTARPGAPTKRDFVVVLDPGHGGLDPGAARDGVFEANLMLLLGQELMAALSDVTDVQAIMTRDSDKFVPLSRRVSIAREAGADIMISLHADALDVDQARGASVYTLNKSGGDAAATRMLERHAQGDLLSGVDLRGQGDRVATVLMDLARQKTGPESAAFADLLVQQMQDRGVRLNARPRRAGQLAVLGGADFPSVLVEAGFLSNAQDLARLRTKEGRAPLVAAIVAAISAWSL